MVIRAVVIAEDDTFFGHDGVNYQAVWEALRHDVRKKRFARGGSTITQQMIKNVLLSKEKTITRKLREFVLARKAEDILTKRRILEIYLNEVEWGDNIYGIEAASRFYFEKHAQELNPGEAALLAGMLPNPRYYNPFKRMNKATDRQERVLFNMRQAKQITQEEYDAALASPVTLRQEGSGRFDFGALTGGNGRPCYQRTLEHVLVSLYGESAVYRGGMTIRTTLDRTLQEDIRRWEESSLEKTAGVPGTVLTVKQGGVVRAIVCAEGKDEELQALLQAPGLPINIYDTAKVSPDSIGREEIILPAAPQEASREQ
jgi:membrane peptidoglycan carboxypeptidase